MPLPFLAGCLPLQITDPPMAQVSNNPFGVPPPLAAPTKAHFAPGSQETAWRVDRLGREILAANPQLGCKPAFVIPGSPQPEIFHRGDKMLVVTQGLVQQCQSDADLAALLCLELGKIVADRETLVPPAVRNPERLPPIDANFGTPGPDQTSLAELGRFEKERPRKNRPLVRPDPDKLARGYLEKAGFRAEALDAVAPLVRAADRNCALENQFKGILPQSKWTP